MTSNAIANIKLQRNASDDVALYVGSLSKNGGTNVFSGSIGLIGINESTQNIFLASSSVFSFDVPLASWFPTGRWSPEEFPGGQGFTEQYIKNFSIVTTSDTKPTGEIYFSTAYVDIQYTKNTLSKADAKFYTWEAVPTGATTMDVQEFGYHSSDIRVYIFGNQLGSTEVWEKNIGFNIRAFSAHLSSAGRNIRYNLGWSMPWYIDTDSDEFSYFSFDSETNFLSFEEVTLQTSAAKTIDVELAYSFPWLGTGEDEIQYGETDVRYPNRWYGPQSIVLLKSDGNKRTYQISYHSNDKAFLEGPDQFYNTNNIITQRVEIEGTNLNIIEDSKVKMSDLQSNDPNDKYRFGLTPTLTVSNDAIHLNALNGCVTLNASYSEYFYNFIGQFSEVFYRPGFFSFYRSNLATVQESIAKTLYFNFDPTDAESFFNTFNKADYNGINADSEITDFANYTVTPSPTTAAINTPVEGDKYGYVLCKFYSLEDYPDDFTYSFYSPVFKQYKAFAASVQYVQEALDDLYRQLSAISTLEAFGGTETSSTFNSVISGLVGSNRHEETGVVLSANQVYTVNHNLNQKLVTISVYDDDEEEEVSVFTELIDENSLEIRSTVPLTVSLVVIK